MSFELSFYIDTIKTGRELEKWREWRASELEDDIKYCHPRWPQETQYLQSEIDAVRNLSLISSTDWWIYFDWITLVLVLSSIGTHVAFFYYSTDLFKEIHHHTMIPLLMILWFRLFKYARPFEGAGPLVVIFGSVFTDIAKWGFLNSIIIIPFTCAFWITFGAISLHPVTGYDSVGPLLYNMFSMMVVGEHQFVDLVKVNPILSRLLCMGFIGIVAIVTLNLLIALLSNTFERLYENAVANAIMQRGRTILMLEKWMTKRQLNRYYDFIRKNGSPETIQAIVGGMCTSSEDHVNMDRICDDIKTIKGILFDRFGKRYGKFKSPLDVVKEDVTTVKKLQEELVHDTKYTKMMLQRMTNESGLLINVDTHNRSSNNNNNNNDDDNNNSSNYKSNNNNSNNNNSNSNTTITNTNTNNRKSSNNSNNSNNSTDTTTTNITSNPTGELSLHDHHQTTSLKPRERSEVSFLGEESGHDSSQLARLKKKKEKSCPRAGGAELLQRKQDYPVHNLPHHGRFLPMKREEQPDFAHPQSPYSTLDAPRANREFVEKPTQPGPYYQVNPPVHQPWDHRSSPGYLVQDSPRPRSYTRESDVFIPPQHYFLESNQQPQGHDPGRRSSSISGNPIHHPHASHDEQRVREDYYRQPRGSLESETLLQPAMLPQGNIMAYDNMPRNRQRPIPAQDYLRFQEFHHRGFQPDGRRDSAQRSKTFLPQEYLAGYVLPPDPQLQQGALLQERVSLPVSRQRRQQPLPDPSYERRETRAGNKMAYGDEKSARGALRKEDVQVIGTSSDSEESENLSFMEKVEKKVARNLTKTATAVASKIKEKVIYFEEKTGIGNEERKDEATEENEKEKDRESKL